MSMIVFLASFCLPISLLLGQGLAQSNNVHYAIIAAKALRPSSMYNVTVTCYNVVQDVELTLRLQASDDNVLVEKEAVLKNGTTEIVSLEVPDLVLFEYYDLMAIGTGGFSFSESRGVSVKRKTLSLFVQTDKIMYKPGQTVLFRAIALYPDLKPFQRLMDIVVYNPDGDKIMQWLRKQHDTGVVGQSLPLSEQTRLGAWKINVIAEGNVYNRTFEVAEYVLSKFEVSVTLPSYYLVNLNRRDLQDDLKITVMAKYTYGEPVKGRTIYTIQLKPISYMDNSNYTQIMRNVQLVEGKADVSLTINDLASLQPSESNYTDFRTYLSTHTIVVVAAVNETLTGIVLYDKATVPCKSQKYSLTFLDFSPSNFKPGLLYTAYIHLTQSDGSMPDVADITLPDGAYRSIVVQVTTNYSSKYMFDPDKGWYRYVYPSTNDYISVTIDPSGYMTVSLTAKFSNVSSFSLRPSFYVNLTESTVNDYKLVRAFESRDNECIQVIYDSLDGLITAPEEVRFNVTTTKTITAFQYQILSKGNILLSGNVVGNASTEHSFSIWVSKQLAIELSPSARVLVWFITDSGEIIADSKDVAVNDVFANEVLLSFDRESTTPSQKVSLTVSATQGSYVGILAVDQSVLLLKKDNDITQDMVSHDLTGYDTLEGTAKRCNRVGLLPSEQVGRICPPGYKYWMPAVLEGTDSGDLLSNAGLLFMTDGYLYTYLETYTYSSEPPTSTSTSLRPTSGGPVGPLRPPTTTGEIYEYLGVSDGNGLLRFQIGIASDTNDVDNSKPRVEFPETWLWTETITGPDGRVTVNATCPDTITSWVASAFAISQVTGLGVAAKTKLKVFKQFFLSPNLPYSVIRGEEFALKVNVFNYMSTRLNVLVSLRQSNYYKVQGSTSITGTVESNDASSFYFWIMPGSIGQIPIDITAQSPIAGDAVRVMLLVKPEGVKQQYSTSLLVQLSASVPTYTNSLDISFPPFGKLVEGSEYIEITVVGDLIGTSMKGLDSLLQMPIGCGEQNMVSFAPNVNIVKYLGITNQLTANIKEKALDFLITGYQKQLTYQRKDGSFSAFGNEDNCGSVWVSSLTIKSFKQAQNYIPVEDGKIAQTIRWIISNQAANGSFAEPPTGSLLSQAMQEGSSLPLSMTAYVLISLQENQNNSKIDSTDLNTKIALARKYLEDHVSSAASDPYALSIISYALALVRSAKVGDVLQMLEALAKTEVGTKHWDVTSDSSNTSKGGWRPSYSQARSIDIEMTAYVLLTYCQLKNLSMGLPIAKWIVSQRNANGGFSSTQDTVIALEALTKFATLIFGPPSQRNLHVSIATDSVNHNFLPITDVTSILLQSFELASGTRKVSISANGKGSALVQMNVKYNVYETNDVPGISFKVNTTQIGKDKITVEIYCRWDKTGGSGMALMEINHLTGYKALSVEANKPTKRIEYNKEKIVLYFDELTAKETSVKITSEKVFPVGNVKEAPAKVYPYYDPSGGRTVLYGVPKTTGQNFVCNECPECDTCRSTLRTAPLPTTRSTTTTKWKSSSVASRSMAPTTRRSSTLFLVYCALLCYLMQ